MNDTPSLSGTSASSMRLRMPVDLRFLDRIEPALALVLEDWLVAYRYRYWSVRTASLLFLTVKLLSLVGLGLSLVLIALGGYRIHGIRFDFIVTAVFAFLLIFYWDTKKHAARLQQPHRPYWARFARRSARRMLQAARKTVPFSAEYDLRGDLATYYRNRDEGAKLIWTRRLKGVRVDGGGFTLIYAKPRAIHPAVLILHDAPAELGAYLDGLGIFALSPVRTPKPAVA